VCPLFLAIKDFWWAFHDEEEEMVMHLPCGFEFVAFGFYLFYEIKG